MIVIDETATSYQRSKEKLIKKRVILPDQLQETLKAFSVNPNDPRIRPHKINCKHDKSRYSITIIGTQYRVLGSYYVDDQVFCLVGVLSHDDYDRVNKNC